MAATAHPHLPRPQSNLAVAAFVLGLIGIVPAAVVCGVLALRRIKRHGQGGEGFAVAGLALAALWTVAIAALLVVAFTTDAERDPSGRIVEGGSLSIDDVRDGDCLDDVQETDAVLSVEAVPCTEPHDAQVYAVGQVPDKVYPGERMVLERAEYLCAQEFPPIPAVAADTIYYHPTKDSWEIRDDREITCIAVFKRPRSGPLKE